MTSVIKWRPWWFDLLLAGLLPLSGTLVWSHIETAWLGLIIGLVIFLAGYVTVRPRLALSVNGGPPEVWDSVGCILIVAGLAIGSYADNGFSVLLTVACPVVWNALRDYRPGALANVGLICVTSAAIGLKSFHLGTLGEDWPQLLIVTLVIVVFSVMIGSMVDATKRWGQERAELVDDLLASQSYLGESYQILMAADATEATSAESPLSARECEVLALASQGCTNRGIGLQLFISPATVKTHMEHILTKLGATTRTQAVLIAHQSGLLPAADDLAA